MLRIKVIELDSIDLKKETTNATGGKLLYNNTVIVDGKDSIVDLYEKVLGFLATKKGVDIRQGLGGTFNEDGTKINTTSVMKKVTGTNIYVDTKNNSYVKFQKMLRCFKELQKKESIDSYLFEIERYEEEGSSMMSPGREDRKMVDIDKIVRNNKQIIFTGAPGTGKTYSIRRYVQEACTTKNENDEKIIDEKQYKFVQFHPSYDYSDFVEGLRPVVLLGQTEATFVRLDGTFKAFCRHIVEENKPDKKYYFIVDEINRADLAKVFGELMFGLEDSYRGIRNKFDTQYKNLVTYRILTKNDIENSNGIYRAEDIGKAVPMDNDVFQDGFYIPENLYFIGTMNDIDRSVDSMDFALRRRFKWINIEANAVMEKTLTDILQERNKDVAGKELISIKELADRVIQMNKTISESKFGLTEAYHIGPAYFKQLDVSDYEHSLKDIFEDNIVSILKEYTRGRKQEDVDSLVEACRQALLGAQ